MNPLVIVWWGFAVLALFILLGMLTDGQQVDPLGATVGLLVWAVVAGSLVWFLRLPRRPTSS